MSKILWEIEIWREYKKGETCRNAIFSQASRCSIDSEDILCGIYFRNCSLKLFRCKRLCFLSIFTIFKITSFVSTHEENSKWLSFTHSANICLHLLCATLLDTENVAVSQIDPASLRLMLEWREMDSIEVSE